MTGDFEQDVRSGEYTTKVPYKDNKKEYRANQDLLTNKFYEDAEAYAVQRGVPKQYANKVVSQAWSDGHSYGFSEVLNHLDNLIEIFQ